MNLRQFTPHPFQLAISEAFETVDAAHLPTPARMLVDYVRVYQRKGQENIGCSPKNFPTESVCSYDSYFNFHTEFLVLMSFALVKPINSTSISTLTLTPIRT
jgi:hypothetical protein